MLDYKLLEALAAIVESGGFEKAADHLHITQSAISQRLKNLEDQLGQVLLMRANPPRLTIAGQRLMKHFLQVQHLEGELSRELSTSLDSPRAPVSLAINADSMATWFFDRIEPFVQKEGILLDIRVEDQERTHQLLKSGEVVGSISTYDKSIQGCNQQYLGTMVYHMVASPEFSREWFPDGLTRSATSVAPAVIFNRKDGLHDSFLLQNLGIERTDFPTHYIPSSEKFYRFMVAGLGYGLLPKVQSSEHLKSGALVDLSPGHTMEVRLYYHYWNINSKRLLQLSSLLNFEQR